MKCSTVSPDKRALILRKGVLVHKEGGTVYDRASPKFWGLGLEHLVGPKTPRELPPKSINRDGVSPKTDHTEFTIVLY